MVIAVDARFFKTNEATDNLLKKLFYQLAEINQKHTFIFFFDKPVSAFSASPNNIITVVITPAPTNIFLYKWWYDIKIYLALRKHKATIFIGTNGICSLTTAVPQLLIIQNFNFLHYSVSYPKPTVSFYKKYATGFLGKAAAIITFSDFTKQEAINTFKIPAQKITSIGCAANDYFKPLSWAEKEKVKEKYARGCEYFIFSSTSHRPGNLINLLKAFSVFKKWQKTNMKLLITVNSKLYKEAEEKLKSYKYKNEVNILHNLSDADFAIATAGSYAMISTSSYESSGLAVIEALQCETPVITSPTTAMEEIAGDAALYADAAKPEEIADCIKRIYKDEQLRNNLIAAGKERVKIYSYDKTIALLWQQIEEVTSK